MPTIVLITRINAPIEQCFDAARSLEMHVQTAASTKERIASHHTSDLLALHDVVTFDAVHLGVRQRLTAQIVEFDPPNRFVDDMLRGVFVSLRHVHEFRRDADATVMTDTLTWTSPLGPLGRLADVLFVRSHLTRFLRTKQTALKHVVEERAA